MIRPSAVRHGPATWLILGLLLAVPIGSACAQTPTVPETTPGQFFTITEPITNETIQHIRAATRQLVDKNAGEARGKSPILVFEFLPGETAPGSSEFGASFDLANLISKELGGARLTVAYVPQPLKGYAVLPVIACTEIVMAGSSSLGPITPENQTFDPAFREPVRFLALRKTRDPDFLLGMLDRDADLRLVRTADKTLHYVMAENLEEFRKGNQVNRRAARLGRGPAGRSDRRAGPRGGLLQGPGREPHRSRSHLPDRGPVLRRGSHAGPGDPTPSGSRSAGRSTRSRSGISPAGSIRLGRSESISSSSRSTAPAAWTRPPTALPIRSRRSAT